MSAEPLEAYLSRPMHAPAAGVLEAIDRGPLDPSEALDRDSLDRLLDPASFVAENGWTLLPDGVGYVAVRTPMPGVSGEMVDWWFDWHPRETIRYRIWHPLAHIDNSYDPPAATAAKQHWGATHHPVEDIGTGVIEARIEFCAPTELGFATDALDDPRIATIVGGFAGDERLRMRHTLMVHVFLREGDGVVLRSRFWLGAALRPYLPGPVAAAAERVLNRRALRRRAIPADAPRALAVHCAEEFANLGSLLPELHARFAHVPGRAA